MDWEPWIHVAHITAAAIWVGGGVMLSLVGIHARRSDDLAVVREFAQLLSFVGLRVLMPAVIVVLLSGLWLVLASSEWSLTQLWIVLALGAFVVAFLIGAVYLSRVALQLERDSVTAPNLAAGLAGIRRWLVGYGVVLAVLLFVIWDMVFKPGL